MKSYKLKYEGISIFWFSKKPYEFVGHSVKFKDGEVANLKKYLHRENGPAVEYANGTKQWWINGKLHRKDGPAVEYANGGKFWYWHGEEI